jgi:hypothetical protein
MTRTLTQPLRLCLLLAVLALAAACVTTAKKGNGGLDQLRSPAAGGTTTPTGAPTTKASSASGPQIVFFRVTQQPACPFTPSSDAPFTGAPAQDIKVAWKVSGGVTKVALSIDDPTFFDRLGSGSWQTYDGTTHEEDLPFACDGSHPTSTHKYTINTIGGGQSVSQTLTVSIPSHP